MQMIFGRDPPHKEKSNKLDIADDSLKNKLKRINRTLVTTVLGHVKYRY